MKSNESRLSYTPTRYGGAEINVERRGIPEVDRIGSTGLSMTIKASRFPPIIAFLRQIHSIASKRAS